MSIDIKDLKRLQWAIALFVAMAAVGGFSVWTSHRLNAAGEKALRQAITAQTDIKGKLARAREEQQELQDKIGRFKGLQAMGYIGSEKRLDWVEAIDRIKAERRIFRLDYDFAPQRPAEASIVPGGAAAGNFEIMASQMRLNILLLHEEELLAFLGELRKAVQAMILVRSCAIERLASTEITRSVSAQLSATCTLEWITLKEGR